MRIAVLNGSPKGDLSVTLHYAEYLRKRHAGHDWKVHNVASDIRGLEAEPSRLEEVIRDISESGLVIWVFPVYYMLCCSQYKRFIELVSLAGHSAAFSGIPAASIVTSIKFYDHTALNYVRGVSEDLGMHYCGEYSARARDLLKKVERVRLSGFFRRVVQLAEEGRGLARRFDPVGAVDLEYSPSAPAERVSTEGRKWMLVTDMEDCGANLRSMVGRFREGVDGNLEIIDLSKMDFAPCTGCCRCGFDNRCMHGEDAYVRMHRDRLQRADVLVFAGRIRDRYLSARWKGFFDRSFFMGHTPSLRGVQLGFLVSGRLARLQNLREILTAWSETMRVNLVDIVTDETGSSRELDAGIAGLARGLALGAASEYVPPPTFRQVGGMKIFRDDIWGPMRPVFQADHRYYRRNGLYDFPQRNLGRRLLNLFLPGLLRLPPVRRRFERMMPRGMVERQRRLVEGTAPVADGEG
jgi:multimeric flavodoxin WrbA